MNTEKTYYLFVYGSLLSGFRSPAYEYISRYFTLISPARIRGKLYDMGDYPAAVPCTDELFIKGELYLIKNESEFSWALGQLDDYEGVTPEPGEVQSYSRELTTIYLEAKTINAWVYWYKGDIGNKPVVESGDILQYHQQKNN